MNIKEEMRSLKVERILQEARSLFYERGYHGTTLDAVAERLNVTKPFIYQFFRNKSELLLTIYGRCVERSIECVVSARADNEDPRRQLEVFARNYTRLVIAERTEVAIFFREERNIPEEHKAEINRLKGVFDAELAALIQGGVAQGVFNVPDVRLATLAIVGMISWIYEWYREGQRLAPDEISTLMYEYARRIVGDYA